jgi:hypothetical protein
MFSSEMTSNQDIDRGYLSSINIGTFISFGQLRHIKKDLSHEEMQKTANNFFGHKKES